ncbi:structural maintenance of chromosome 1, putative [Trypanosoma brucei brucei TREU927]|uniref:Structural maintenance of chromosomes protein n=1 Tax=Trypanosoma brucei brucei (strain 927/4 GUTat10.1) TaxID=185431 RepID=Q38DK9_TRYB2|nr:structural maintenance of chromosome 1, putative [Trypanosoma brucei brucei TREU927]EAN77111.1 structural maintenance of chromosome 1, putative [Trypanosoma brucei brucei TREU927]
MSSRIERVELFNFKSYSGHVTIGPLKDFTCIVGPNGSGKSNLMDALCFVLSSNSTATLRGGSPTDFIHRGAQQRECFVTVVLRHSRADSIGSSIVSVKNGGSDNMPETSFTRIVDSAGRIKHKVNGKPVGEEDFVSALRKVNIGPRVNNFLVFQNEVQSVSKKKAQELTEFLERVSGSIEFKEEYDRLKKTGELAKIELAKAAAARREAGSALTVARDQKKETEKYSETMKRISEERCNEALVELLSIENRIRKQKRQLALQSAELEKLMKTFTSAQDAEEMKRTYAEKNKSYLEEINQNRKDISDLRNLRSSLDNAMVRLEHLKRSHDEKRRKMESVLANEENRSRQKERIEEEIRKQKALLAAFDGRCKEEDKNYTSLSDALNKEQLKEYGRLRVASRCQTSTLRQQVDRVRGEQQSMSEGKKQCLVSIENITMQRDNLLVEVQRSDALITELQQRQEELRERAKELSKNSAMKQAEITHAERRNREAEVELEKINAQLGELHFIEENDKREAKVTEALEELKVLHGVRGRLVDLCTIPNNKYRHAVTVALGKNLEAVVVDTSETAHACVRYLKERRLPPLTFLPLNSVNGSAVDDRLRTLGGTCKPVVDVICFDASIEAAVRYALGQTLVCDTMGEGRRIAYGQSSGERFKVVTCDGTVLRRNGVVQGGLAATRSRAQKWDKKKYEDLRAAQKRLIEGTNGWFESELSQLRHELQGMQEGLRFTEQRQKAVKEEIERARSKVEGLRQKVKQQEAELHAVEERRASYEEGLKRCEKELEAGLAAIKRAEQELFGDFQKRVNIPNLLEYEQNDLRRANEREEQRQTLLMLIGKLELSLNSNHGHVTFGSKDLRAECEEIESLIKKCEAELTATKKVVKEKEVKVNETGARVVQLRGDLMKLKERRDQQDRRQEDERQKLRQVRQVVRILEAGCETFRLQRMNVVRRCQMENVPILLKPVDAVGKKRLRPSDADDLSFSEPFALIEADTPDPSQQSQQQDRRPALKAAAEDGRVMIDFSVLSENLRLVAANDAQLSQYKQRTASLLETLQRTVESLGPNLRAATRVVDCEAKLALCNAQFDAVHKRVREIDSNLMKVKHLRTKRFFETYNKIAVHVGNVYKGLTKSDSDGLVHGIACLNLENEDEPYLGGTLYNATPPMKRCTEIERLSGGERTMAALALLFAVHATSPTPFFVLDEVDAALDAANVQRLAKYTRENCNTTQFIVISLMDQLYHMADMLVGVLKDKERGSSSILTMDLSSYPLVVGGGNKHINGY